MIVIGIDPGLTGACAILDHTGVRALFDLPTMPIPGVGERSLVQRKIDGYALCKLLLQHCPAREAVTQVLIEAVGTMGGRDNAVQTQGSLLRSLGAIETVAECLKFPVQPVHTQSWKRYYGLLDSSLKANERKAVAMQKARALYPDRPELARAKDHNRAEALLIAHYGVRKLI
jgi:hypothetical protein